MGPGPGRPRRSRTPCRRTLRRSRPCARRNLYVQGRGEGKADRHRNSRSPGKCMGWRLHQRLKCLLHCRRLVCRGRHLQLQRPRRGQLQNLDHLRKQPLRGHVRRRMERRLLRCLQLHSSGGLRRRTHHYLQPPARGLRHHERPHHQQRRAARYDRRDLCFTSKRWAVQHGAAGRQRVLHAGQGAAEPGLHQRAGRFGPAPLHGAVLERDAGR